MKEVIRYEALDGLIFVEKQKCIEYDELIRLCWTIEKQLKPVPKDDGCKFANGGGYIQQEQGIKEKIKGQIEKLAITRNIVNRDSIGMLGRYLSDSTINKPLNHIYYRIQSIDSLDREWGQAYFALNPSKGTQQEFKE